MPRRSRRKDASREGVGREAGINWATSRAAARLFCFFVSTTSIIISMSISASPPVDAFLFLLPSEGPSEGPPASSKDGEENKCVGVGLGDVAVAEDKSGRNFFDFAS